MVKRLNKSKLHVTFAPPAESEDPVYPRCYTLTHSDRTGELFLTIGATHDHKQISGLAARLLRDEVLAEWEVESGEPILVLHCHVSGGIVLGTAAWRDQIFRHELPLVLEALRYGDSALFDSHPELDDARIKVYFHSHDERFNRLEDWGSPSDYR